MKVHYINILLFVIPLNILGHNQRNHKITTSHTQTNRSLCECELYAPVNYDNDRAMKKVMQQFEDRTSQRFHEYDDRMVEKRKQCKEQCDKEVQKIILKDKLEKQMAQHLTTLETKITTDDIPTCVCEKSIAHKVEKGCLKCTQNLGGIVTPSSGVLAGIGEAAISVLKPAALKAAAKYAMKEGAAQGLASGIQAGKEAVIGAFKLLDIEKLSIGPLDSFFTEGYYINITKLTDVIFKQRSAMCGVGESTLGEAMCTKINTNLGTIGPYALPDQYAIPKVLKGIVGGAQKTADYVTETTTESVTAELTTKNTNLINSIYGSWDTAITASIIAILVIVIILVIIYLILRYRRKKKMKKKLQYIKLLEE
ncbi:rifin [Plasmodium reichenowi]|uniref:Rifin n=1 Tax=Plasmodium reichenowi TaxID=5854 RepID=A0A151L243_PLARE|nr:rifin [Plasmodium reichenowi]KYN93018.1 rifin [Plasmodium reichenowi]